MKYFQLLFIIVFMYGCTGKKESAETKNIKKEPLKKISLTVQEVKYLKPFQSSKKMRVAMRKGFSYKRKAKELNFLFLKEFSKTFDLNFEIIRMDLKDYFKFQGKIPANLIENSSYSYRPDIFKKVELVADNITILEWRKKLFTMIHTYSTKVMAVTRLGEELKEMKELNGKTIAVMRGSSYETLLKKIQKKQKLQFRIVYTISSEKGLEKLSQGKYDVVLVDSDYFITFLKISKKKNLNSRLIISDTQYLSWLVAKDNPTLAGILRKFFDYMNRSGKMADLFMESHEFSFSKYKEMIGLKKGVDK